MSSEMSGGGIIATVDGREIAAGNDKLMDSLGIAVYPVPSAQALSYTLP